MPRQVVLLRGINLGPHNRIAMPALREALTAAGFANVATYVQSGNAVLGSDLAAAETAEAVRRVLDAQFDLQVPVVVRTRAELADVVARDPLAGVATDPKRYQVSFLSGEPDPDALERVQAQAAPAERLVAIGRELYAWHPDGIGRSKMWNALAGKGLGVIATARNWTTVTTLLKMVDQ